MKLSSYIVEFYRKNGFVILRGALSKDDLQPVINGINRWIDIRAEELYSEGSLQHLFRELNFEERFTHLLSQDKKMREEIDIMYSRIYELFNFTKNQKLLDIIESIIGPEITCNPIQHLRVKPPSRILSRHGFDYPGWHQDITFMHKDAENTDIINCWIPLVDTSKEMGCIKIIPGVFNYLPHYDDKYLGRKIERNSLPSSYTILGECKKGDIILLSAYTPHKSTPNITNKCRWSLDLRYHPTGQNSGRLMYPEYIVRSKNKNNKNLSYKEWCQLWKEILAKEITKKNR